MLSEEFIAGLKWRLDLWADDVLADFTFKSFVVPSLCEVDAQTYELSDLLSEDAVAMLLKNGGEQLRYEDHGGMRIISDGHLVDISDLAPKYRKLFKEWASRGWVELADNSVRRL